MKWKKKLVPYFKSIWQRSFDFVNFLILLTIIPPYTRNSIPSWMLKNKLENVFMKHYAPNHMLAPKKKGSNQKWVQPKPS